MSNVNLAKISDTKDSLKYEINTCGLVLKPHVNSDIVDFSLIVIDGLRWSISTVE